MIISTVNSVDWGVQSDTSGFFRGLDVTDCRIKKGFQLSVMLGCQ